MTVREVNAFVLRVAPGRESMLGECLERDRVVIGWPGLVGLLDASIEWPDFRRIVSTGYYADEQTLRKAGAAAGHLWRFIREMETGDIVVVPAPARKLYIARIAGPAEAGTTEAVGYLRSVEWLNEKRPIERQLASAALQSRMKIHGSTAAARDLLPAIGAVLGDAERVQAGEPVPTFERDLRRDLLAKTLEQLRSGRVDSFKFERIVQVVLESLGAADCSITARSLDKGDDIVATVLPLGLFELRLVAQVKHYYQLDRPLGAAVLDELLSGMAKQAADLGLVITVGVVSEEAEIRLQELNDTGQQIAIVDGEQLAELYLDHCVGNGRNNN